MTLSRFCARSVSTWPFSAKLSRNSLWETNTAAALSSSFACSSFNSPKTFSATFRSSAAALELASAFLEFFTIASASNNAFLTSFRSSSQCLVHSSKSALARLSSSPPMFMIWLCKSRTSSSTLWCDSWISLSSPSRDAINFSNSFNFDFSPALSVGTFSDLSLCSYASDCFVKLAMSMLHFSSRNWYSAISFSVMSMACSKADFSWRMACNRALAFS
mmetsp:Transcript_60707/g.170076  ORF Transcript_60707/g.170076 Transcript_60707/m.170076 type:complete len:218 (+) Transcript_60707:1477-2130(+)